MRTLMLGLVALFLTGCSDTVFGPAARGTYDLYRVNGRRAPATVYEEVNRGTVVYALKVENGDLTLRGDGSFFLRMEIEEFDEGIRVRSTEGYAGQWEEEFGEIFFYFVDPVTGRNRTLSGTLRDYRVDVLVPGLVSGQQLALSFER